MDSIKDLTIVAETIPAELRRGSIDNIQKMAEIIRRFVYFAKDEGRVLYYYDNGVYKPRGEEIIEVMYHKILAAFDSLDRWRPRRAKDITDYILPLSPFLIHKPKTWRINLLNGIYNLELNQLELHDPTYLNTVQIPINYDPNAQCPGWDKFLFEVFPEGVDFMLQIIGICMVPFTSMQKCIILVGSGSNGKSTFLNGLQAAIGLDNVSNVALHTLVNPMEKFAKAMLVGKLVNIFGDLSTKKIEDAANFKPLTGQDRITIEYKHKQAFSYTPFCKLLFSCNEVMKSDDDSIGYKRRFIHIPFTRQFDVDPSKGMELDEELASPSELSGLLNRIIQLLPSVLENGFEISEAVASVVDNYQPIPDSIKRWLWDNLVVEEGAYLPAAVFYDWLLEHCNAGDLGHSRRGTIQHIRNLFPTVQASVNHRIMGRQMKCYVGIRMKDPAIQAYIEQQSSVSANIENVE